MKIKQCGEGIHVREIPGIERFKHELPASWYGWSNLDCVIGAGKAREIDLIAVSPRYIFLIDLKDWNGTIESVDGGWSQNGRGPEPSPVQKITRTTRELGIAISKHIKKNHAAVKNGIPLVLGLVAITGNADISNIAANEKGSVFRIDNLLKIFGSNDALRTTFGNVNPNVAEVGLHDISYQNAIKSFFNGANFQPGKKSYQDFVAEELPDFVPSNGIYEEYEARGPGPNNFGTLRRWNFAECPNPHFMTQEGRLEIAGREHDVYNWLKDRSDQIERLVLPPRYEDTEKGPSYWQIFERRQRMKRLQSFIQTDGKNLLPEERLELVRQLLAVVVEMHSQNAAHLDIGPHSVWLESPTSVRLSHLFVTRYPEISSLGDNRFQFLSTVALPDDVLGLTGGHKRRDVFCLAVAAHQILFGRPPGGDPYEWNASIDENKQFTAVHEWFELALEHNPDDRYEDAVVAQKAFLSATASSTRTDQVVSAVEGYRRDVKTQGALIRNYPVIGPMIKETDKVEIWRSEVDKSPVVVKLWKKPSWHDDLASVHRFLNHAENFRLDRPEGFPDVLHVYWLGDAFALIIEWKEGVTLEERMNGGHGASDEGGIEFLEMILKLIDQIDRIHENNHAHGDLKPENVIITSDGELKLIDALDFRASADGEPVSSHYAPDTGNAFARDRFAITRIVEDFAPELGLIDTELSTLALGVQNCRDREPKLSTLSPLRESIEAILYGVEDGAGVERISIAIKDARIGPIFSDEGSMKVRTRRSKGGGTVHLHLRGGSEELVIRLDQNGKPNRAFVEKFDIRWLSNSEKQEFVSLPVEFEVIRNTADDWSFFDRIIENATISERLSELLKGTSSIPDDLVQTDESEVQDEAFDSRELVEEALLEEINESSREVAEIGLAAMPRAIDVDVAGLWQSLITIEDELSTRALVMQESVFNERDAIHRVAVELSSGVLDYSREDSVAVEVWTEKGSWHRIGYLDIGRSSEQEVLIRVKHDTQRHGRVRSLVSEGQTLKFTSHFEQTSFRRRKNAVEKMLRGDGRQSDLLSVFSGKRIVQPSAIKHLIDEELLQTYGLNEDQQSAFRKVLTCRPLGMLQGPPGTGKTRFISALAHYAITKGLARNVLLTSQSHEAVNTASETVLRLFRKNGVEPSMLRVGMNEAVVSPDLRPYHTSKVEEVLKDRFRAAFPQRLEIIADRLGVTSDVTEIILALESHVRPLANRYQDSATSKDEIAKSAGLRDTLISHLDALGMTEYDVPRPEDLPEDFSSEICKTVMSYAATFATDPSVVERLRRASVIGRDFVTSVSRGQRNFEAFLAGTRQIVAGTCVGLGREALGLTATAFDLVIVDEAARCTPSELLVPLQAARWTVLVGDHKQLKPLHNADVVAAVSARTKIPKSDVIRSDFERVFDTHYGHAAGASLRTQYRMLPAIGRLVSEAFYPELVLQSGRDTPYIDPGVLPATLGHPLTWIETDGMGAAGYESKSNDSTSRINRAEADAIVATIEQWIAHAPFADWLKEESSRRAGIGIICMYAAQRDEIHRKLRNSSVSHFLDNGVKVGTVDSYQGKENPIIILSLVRNNADGFQEMGSRRIREGFLSEPNRINVAASRAMDRLVIVGARQRWPAKGPVRRLADGFLDALRTGEAALFRSPNDLGADTDQAIGEASLSSVAQENA